MFGCPSLRCKRSISFVVLKSLLFDSTTLATFNSLLLEQKDIIDKGLLMQFIDSYSKDRGNSTAHSILRYSCTLAHIAYL